MKQFDKDESVITKAAPISRQKLMLTWILIGILTTSNLSYGQFDEEDAPPPPPPPTSGNDRSAGRPPSFNPAGTGNSAFNPGGNAPRVLGRSGAAPGMAGDSGSSTVPSDNGPLNTIKKDKLAAASVDEINGKNFPEMIDSFDYNNAEINDVIKAISEMTGKNFILDQNVRGKITIIAPTKISVAEAYKAFLAALAANGLAVVPSGSFLKIKQSRAAQRDNIDTYSGAYFPNSDTMITKIVHLKYIRAESIRRDLNILTSRDGELNHYEPTNSLIISDYGSSIERIMKIIAQLDVPGFEEKLVVIQIRNAKSKDLAELINKIVNKDTSSKNAQGGSFSAGVPRFGGSPSTGPSGSKTGSGYFMVIPDDRTNSLIVVGNTPGIGRVRKLIDQLDFKVKLEDSGGVQVYYVKYGDAEKISQTLTGIAKDNKPTNTFGPPGFGGPGGGSTSAPTSGNLEIFGGTVKFMPDKDTNSLVITGSKQDYEVVLNLLAKLDIPRDQVYVEAIIMEMNSGNDLNYGAGYFNFDPASKGVGRVGFNGVDDITKLLNPTGGQGLILGFGKGDSVPIQVGSTVQQVPSLVGFIQLLNSVSRTNILSTPQILALDNQQAEIEVGEKIAISQNTQTVNGVTTQNPNYETATLKLVIKPFISPTNNQIQMEVDQTIDAPSATTGINNSISISKRHLKTKIRVPDGDTAVLGGLMKDRDTEVVTKIPILGDIPILGWLFKSRATKKEKANLLVFLTPKILRTQKERAKLLDKKLDERIDFIKSNGGKDPHGRIIDQLPRLAENPQDPTAQVTDGTVQPSPAAPKGALPQAPAHTESAPPPVMENNMENKMENKLMDDKLEQELQQSQ